MRNYCKLLATVLFVFLTLGSCLYSGHYVLAQTDQAASKLQAANNAVEQALNAVLGAEKAGANITGLLAQLNVAGGDLAQAENSYRTGNFSAAEIRANNVLPIAQGVTGLAQNAKQTALVSAQDGFWFTISFLELVRPYSFWFCFRFGAGLNAATRRNCLV